MHLTGKCLCGAITYEINGELGEVFNCHCSKCRTWGGDAFRSSTKVKAKDFQWLSGENHLARYPASAEVVKTFCRICGTNLISYYPKNSEFIGLSLGGLQQDPGVRPKAHIYVGSKAPWYEIEDSLPQYDEAPKKSR